jgi:hypothetical protein
MVVRIMEDDQYRLDDSYLPFIEQLDEKLHTAMTEDNAELFYPALQEAIELVRAKGTKVPHTEVIPSNIVLPAPDMTLEEMHKYLDVDPAY